MIAEALITMETIGFVHRDIKPKNIMITSEGEIKLCDLGLAKSMIYSHKSTLSALGTPYYMSPEQARTSKVDIRSDIYSLGMTLYHMLAGKPPYEGKLIDIVDAHIRGDIIALA
jgi:serine/threonine-protein kinase